MVVVKKWIFTDGDNSQQYCLINKNNFHQSKNENVEHITSFTVINDSYGSPEATVYTWCCKKYMFLKVSQIRRETPMSESLFNKDAGADSIYGYFLCIL